MRWVASAELRHSPMLAAVPVLAFLGGLAAWRGLLPGVASWDATSLAVLGATQLLGPVAAGLACWTAQREHRRRLEYLRVLADSRGPAVPLFQLGAAVLWVLVAYLAVCGALAAYTIGHHGTGRIAADAIVAGCLGAAVHVAAGYLVGTVVPWRLAAPLVAVGSYVAVVVNMDYSGSWFYLLSPVTVEQANVFVAWREGVFTAQALWLGAVAAVLVVLVTMTARVTLFAVVAGVVALLLGAAGAGRLQAYDGHVFASAVPRTALDCAGRDPTVCLHPGFRGAAATIARTFRPLTRRLAGTSARVSVLQHRAVWDRSGLPAGAAPLYLDDLAPGYADRARDYFVQDLTRSDGCRAPAGRLYSEVVSAWLLDVPVTLPPPYEEARARFARATEQERRAWMARHFDAYRSCVLTGASFADVG